MRNSDQNKSISYNEIEKLVTAESSQDRLKLISDWKKSNLTINDQLLRGFSKMPISQSEIIAMFEICSTSHPAEFELWIMNHVLKWEQNIAAVAIRSWARVTERILWHRLLPIVAIPGLPQRISYSILDVCNVCHGYEITSAILNGSSWENLSGAFHALLIERSLQYDLPSTRLTHLSRQILNSISSTSHPENKAMLPAIAWLCRHDLDFLKDWTKSNDPQFWTQFLKLALESCTTSSTTLNKLEKNLEKFAGSTVPSDKLPPLWSRSGISSTICQSILTNACNDSTLICGIKRKTLQEQSFHNGEPRFHESWTNHVIGALPMANTDQPVIPEVNAFSKSYDQKIFKTLAESRKLAITGKLGIVTDKITAPSDFSIENPRSDVANQYHPIQEFFLAVMGHETMPQKNESIWSQLARHWYNPANVDIGAITIESRKHKGIAPLAHIMLMSKMKGRDEAVLKLLDHIRSPDESELKAVVLALGQIDTPRSLLELIAMLTRPNSTVSVQQEIVSVLQQKNLDGLQKELRSAIQDLHLPENTDHPIYQIKDDLASMIKTPITELHSAPLAKVHSNVTSDGSLDTELTRMIPHYKDLSSEVKRALRTALFFNQTVTESQHANAIDLSPLIDMQYKAMELLFREFFEDSVSHSLQRGAIQQKLDVIGYARPIVRQMDEFESYIANLPLVREIPFFSKFKLRKMLRAICQFEPGRRFTLDGLKAFGLYFLVFGRQNCKYGLAGTFSTGASNDLDLAEFCKELHIFQDFRNRAAHEGFHPDASNDVMGIWRTTASVVQWAFKVREAQKQAFVAADQRAS